MLQVTLVFLPFQNLSHWFSFKSSDSQRFKLKSFFNNNLWLVKLKICLSSSSGGHLTQLLKLNNVWKKHDHFFLTFKVHRTEHLSKKERVHFVKDPKRNPFLLILNFLQSLVVFLMENPDVIVSSGTGVTVPMCIWGKLFGKKVIFIESYSRVTTPSLSGRIVYPIANLFIVQWKDLRKKYPKAVYVGRLA